MKLLVANLLLLFSNISGVNIDFYLIIVYIISNYMTDKWKLYGLLDRDFVITLFFSSLTKPK